MIAKSVFTGRGGLTHVLDMVRAGNLAPNNVGPMLAWDFLLPVVMVTLYILARPARDRVVITPAGYRSTRWRRTHERSTSDGPAVSSVPGRARHLWRDEGRTSA